MQNVFKNRGLKFFVFDNIEADARKKMNVQNILTSYLDFWIKYPP